MAETTVRVRVTQEDIDAGVRGMCAGCPVALAVARAIPTATHVGIWAGAGILEFPDRIVDFELGELPTVAIAGFDEFGTMSPFEFDLPLPAMESANG